MWLRCVQAVHLYVCVCLHPAQLADIRSGPRIGSQSPTSSNASFEVELDEPRCIKVNKSSVRFYGDIPPHYKDKRGAL